MQVWNCERRTHVQSPKSTLFKVSRMFADEYLLFIPPAIPCSLISGDDWTILSGLWRLKIRGSPSDSPDGGIPGAREIPHVPQIPSAGCDLRKLVYSAWADVQSEQRQQYSTGQIIYYNPVQWEQISLIHILFRITTKHDYYSFPVCMLLPQSPRQITIRAPDQCSTCHGIQMESPAPVSCQCPRCLSADDPNSTILSPHETCFIIPLPWKGFRHQHFQQNYSNRQNTKSNFLQSGGLFFERFFI